MSLLKRLWLKEGPAKPEPENKQAEVEKTEVKIEEAPVQQPQVEENKNQETAGNKGRRIGNQSRWKKKKATICSGKIKEQKF